MILNKNTVQASYTKNGTTHTIKLAEYCTNIQEQYNKLWDADAGRNLAKSVVGSFDIFPKFVCYFKPLNRTEIEAIAPLLNAQSQSFTYYDPELKTSKTIATYTGDWSSDNKRPNLNEAFNVSFIARNRRS